MTQQQIDQEFLRRTRDRDFGEEYTRQWKQYNQQLREYQHITQNLKALGWNKLQTIKSLDVAKALGYIKEAKQDVTDELRETTDNISDYRNRILNKLVKEKKGGIKGSLTALALTPEILVEMKRRYNEEVDKAGGTKEYWKQVADVPIDFVIANIKGLSVAKKLPETARYGIMLPIQELSFPEQRKELAEKEKKLIEMGILPKGTSVTSKEHFSKPALTKEEQTFLMTAGIVGGGSTRNEIPSNTNKNCI